MAFLHNCNRKRPSRLAFSLLEMVMASTLMVSALVPTMAVMRDAMAKSRDLHRRNLLANYAVRVVESQAAAVMVNWTSANTSGNFASDGHTNVRFTCSRSDVPADGGLTGQLMHIQVTVFDDVDDDGSHDANENSVFYRTKVARLESYENEE